MIDCIDSQENFENGFLTKGRWDRNENRLFTDEPIPKGGFIGFYNGVFELIENDETDLQRYNDPYLFYIKGCVLFSKRNNDKKKTVSGWRYLMAICNEPQ